MTYIYAIIFILSAMKLKSIIIPAVAALLGVTSCNQSNNKTKTETAMESFSTNETASEQMLLPEIGIYLKSVEQDFSSIPPERKESLSAIAAFVKEKNKAGQVAPLVFICTHNSRRSHMSQFWAQASARYYSISNVECFSGGTEATAFNPRAVKALRKAGFLIEQTDSSENPVYFVRWARNVEPVKAFSKKFTDISNPQQRFAAIMTCSHADEACPFVPGAEKRISIPYDDPKEADNTPEEEQRYDVRCRQIATEMLYAFSLVE